MASAIAAASLASNAQTRKSGRGIGAKMIGGLGVALTVATVTAVMMSASPSSTAVAPQAATTYAAVPAAAPVSAPVAIYAPLQASPATAVTPPASVPAAATAAGEKNECKVLPRRFFVTGSGTVRVRADGFVSRNVALSDVPQEVDLPQRRPMTGEVQQNIVVEGQANFVLLTTDYDFKQGLRVNGTSNFDIFWVPPANC